jgi:hypothetical protein
MNVIVEDRGKNRFAKGQSSRELRASSDGEQETPLIEATNNFGDFLRFIEISTRVNVFKQRRLF